tara:strand:+ start:1229 stop:1423 length:195 start_codon:yes stop_codon:yes gene_type:complete
MLTITQKITELEHAKRNIVSEYDELIKKHSKMNVYDRNHPLEESLSTAIHSIKNVLESLKKEIK